MGYGINRWGLLLLLGTSNKLPVAEHQMRFWAESHVYIRNWLLLLYGAQWWRIQFIYWCVLKSDAMSRDSYIRIWIARACDVLCCLVCNIIPRVIWIWICAIPVQSLVCNNRVLFFGTLLVNSRVFLLWKFVKLVECVCGKWVI